MTGFCFSVPLLSKSGTDAARQETTPSKRCDVGPAPFFTVLLISFNKKWSVVISEMCREVPDESKLGVTEWVLTDKT